MVALVVGALLFALFVWFFVVKGTDQLLHESAPREPGSQESAPSQSGSQMEPDRPLDADED
jgi:hypothetical protein